MARADAILAAVQRIHEAPLGPDGWTRALPAIAAAARSQHSIFVAQNAVSGAVEFGAGFGIAPEHLAACTEVAKARALPTWMQALLPGIATQSSAMQSDREFTRSTFYNDAVRPSGAFYAVIVAPLRTRRCDVYLSVSRCLGREDYNTEDVAVLQALTPHLVTALRVADRLVAADLRAAGAGTALDRLEAGVILVDPMGKVLLANRTAEAILAGNDGLGVDREGVYASSHSANRVLRGLIASCTDITMINGGPGGNLEVPRAEARSSLHVVVAPFREMAVDDLAWLGAARPVAIVMISDPEQERRARKADLRRRFRLTETEADVALEILKGDGRGASAARLGITTTTVRTHLSHIFEKTGVHRQAELVRLLMQGKHD